MQQSCCKSSINCFGFFSPLKITFLLLNGGEKVMWGEDSRWQKRRQISRASQSNPHLLCSPESRMLTTCYYHKYSDRFWATEDKKRKHIPRAELLNLSLNKYKDQSGQVPDPVLIVPQGSKAPCLMTLDHKALFFPCFQNSHSFKLFTCLAKLHRLLHCRCPKTIYIKDIS